MPAPGRVLVVATVRAQTEAGSDKAVGACRIDTDTPVLASLDRVDIDDDGNTDNQWESMSLVACDRCASRREPQRPGRLQPGERGCPGHLPAGQGGRRRPLGRLTGPGAKEWGFLQLRSVGSALSVEPMTHSLSNQSAERSKLAVFTACAGGFLAFLDTTIVNTAFPSVASSLPGRLGGRAFVGSGRLLHPDCGAPGARGRARRLARAQARVPLGHRVVLCRFGGLRSGAELGATRCGPDLPGRGRRRCGSRLACADPPAVPGVRAGQGSRHVGCLGSARGCRRSGAGWPPRRGRRLADRLPRQRPARNHRLRGGAAIHDRERRRRRHGSTGPGRICPDRRRPGPPRPGDRRRGRLGLGQPCPLRAQAQGRSHCLPRPRTVAARIHDLSSTRR